MRTTAASSMFGGDQSTGTLNTENSSPPFNKNPTPSNNLVKQTTTPGSRNQNLGPSGAGGVNNDEGESDSGNEDAGTHNQDKKKKKKNKKKNKKKPATQNENAPP